MPHLNHSYLQNWKNNPSHPLLNNFTLKDMQKIIEFFLNECHWIRWIQWIKTKSKSSMVTRDTPYLTTVTLLDVVVKKIFPLLSLGWYLFTVVSHNGYVATGSNGNAHSVTINGNVSVANWVILLVTIPFLIWSWFIEFAEFSEIHLGKTLISLLKKSKRRRMEFESFVLKIQNKTLYLNSEFTWSVMRITKITISPKRCISDFDHC